MPLQVVGLPNLVIPSGSSTSNAVGILDDSWALWIYSPATLTGTISMEVSPSDTGTTDWVTQQSGGVDVTLPASKATPINPIGFKRLRLTSNAVEGQTDTFKLTKQILV